MVGGATVLVGWGGSVRVGGTGVWVGGTLVGAVVRVAEGWYTGGLVGCGVLVGAVIAVGYSPRVAVGDARLAAVGVRVGKKKPGVTVMA